MSGIYDDFVQVSGAVDPVFLGRRFIIRVCKDRTLSVTDGPEKPFNGVAIAVYSVDTLDQAHDLVMVLGSLQYTPHPSPLSSQQMPYGQWRKITIDSNPFASEFEYSDLNGVQSKLHRAHCMLESRRALSAA